MKLELVATTAFGLEAVVRREVEALGYRIIKTEDGRITYMGDERAVVRSNLWLRSADRVYIRMGEFRATEFEELFQQTKALEWESIIPFEGTFPVVGGSVKSALHSVPACQRIIKKAVSVRLSEFYCVDEMPETGAEYRIRFIAHKDSFLMLIDTSGAGLHKRGYRVRDVAAPIKETLAAALVQLSFYRADRVLVDPCCGSGTIAIEAAMFARNIAPGLGRSFASEGWDMIGSRLWKDERKKAYAAIDTDPAAEVDPVTGTKASTDANPAIGTKASTDANPAIGIKAAAETNPEIMLIMQNGSSKNEARNNISSTRSGSREYAETDSFYAGGLRISAMDIDPAAVRAAKANADEAGVSDDIDIVKMDITRWKPGGGIPKGAGKDERVVVISNLPYGKRIGADNEIKAIYKSIRRIMDECPNWSFFLITSDKLIEKELGRKADRRRKLYNGTIETQFYQFHGARPPRCPAKQADEIDS